MSDLLTAEQVAELLGIDVKSVKSRVYALKLVPVNYGEGGLKVWWFTQEAVEHYRQIRDQGRRNQRHHNVGRQA